MDSRNGGLFYDSLVGAVALENRQEITKRFPACCFRFYSVILYSSVSFIVV